jgi:hypothetical protein
LQARQPFSHSRKRNIEQLWLATLRDLETNDNALFGGLLPANTLIGIIQELRAKRMLEAWERPAAPVSLTDFESLTLALQ